VLPKLQREEAEKERRDAAERKLAAERERRETDERARQEASRAAEQQRKAREEAASADPSGWALSDNGSDINWNDATRYCASRGSGWRLPSVNEMQSSYQSGRSAPCGSYMGREYTCRVASKSLLTGQVYWSNEQQDSSEAWVVALYDGSRVINSVRDGGGRRALCIRRP
jgi:hypothetical protein